jgi:hypothetical protein
MIIKYDPKIKYLRRPGTDEIFVYTRMIAAAFPDLVEWIPDATEKLSEKYVGVGEHLPKTMRDKRIKEAFNKIPKHKWAKKFGLRPAMPKIADLRKLVGKDLTLEEVLEVINNDQTSVKAENTEPTE